MQINLNHCIAAQDLMSQVLAEWLGDLAVVAEPYSIAANWLQDSTSRVAIAPRLSTDISGHGYVAAAWEYAVLLGVYFPPGRPWLEFERYLQSLTVAIARKGGFK